MVDLSVCPPPIGDAAGGPTLPDPTIPAAGGGGGLTAAEVSAIADAAVAAALASAPTVTTGALVPHIPPRAVDSTGAPADDGDWIVADGRDVSTLTAAQQANLAARGWTASTVPDMTGRVPIGGAGTGAQTGSNTATLTRANLPAVRISVDVDPDVHGHDVDVRDDKRYRAGTKDIKNMAGGSRKTQTSRDTHSHAARTDPLGNGAPVDITPAATDAAYYWWVGG